MSSALHSMYDIRRANEARGHHWFEPGAMRFFRSRIGAEVWTLPNGAALFISSEQFVGSEHAAPRRYSIRLALPDGEIEQVGEFQQFATLARAKGAAQRLADWCRGVQP